MGELHVPMCHLPEDVPHGVCVENGRCTHVSVGKQIPHRGRDTWHAPVDRGSTETAGSDEGHGRNAIWAVGGHAQCDGAALGVANDRTPLDAERVEQLEHAVDVLVEDLRARSVEPGIGPVGIPRVAVPDDVGNDAVVACLCQRFCHVLEVRHATRTGTGAVDEQHGGVGS